MKVFLTQTFRPSMRNSLALHSRSVLGLTDIKGVEEVNIFKNDGTVIHITGPKIQASIPSNTYVVSGAAENRRIEELIPGILSQLGPESMDYLRSYADMMKAAAGGVGGAMDSVEEGEEEDDEVPDLVENFEEAAAK